MGVAQRKRLTSFIQFHQDRRTFVGKERLWCSVFQDGPDVGIERRHTGEMLPKYGVGQNLAIEKVSKGTCLRREVWSVEIRGDACVPQAVYRLLSLELNRFSTADNQDVSDAVRIPYFNALEHTCHRVQNNARKFVIKLVEVEPLDDDAIVSKVTSKFLEVFFAEETPDPCHPWV